jgi:hypothetical protein
MPAFTFTAPVITEQDEAAEWKALSESERVRIRLEMYGQDRSVDEGQATRAVADGRVTSQSSSGAHHDGFKIMMEAIQASSDADKEAYLEAVRQCPNELLIRESNFEHFLACENNDPWAAAQRLLLYWTVRRDLFGDVCYCPLTLEGAMKDDIEYLKKGFMYLLLPDAHGRPVVFVDRVRITNRTAARAVVARCLFYTFCMASWQLYQDPRHQANQAKDPNSVAYVHHIILLA